MNTQFQHTDMTCPHCGHIIGKQAFFQSFEMKVAEWLNATLAPQGQQGYDVENITDLPGITIQVKYANTFHYTRESKDRLNWSFTQRSMPAVGPDYFILFGLYKDGTQCVFLLSKKEFIALSQYTKEKTYILRFSAKQVSDRKSGYLSRVWKYEILNPEKDLKQTLLNHLNEQPLIPSKAWSQYHDKCITCGTTETKHNARGLCLKCYQKQRVK